MGVAVGIITFVGLGADVGMTVGTVSVSLGNNSKSEAVDIFNVLVF
jgi:hypothetical protein